MQDKKMSNFLLVTKDGESVNGSTILATDLIKIRLKENLWPIYAQTRGRKSFEVGSNVAFYAGGRSTESGRIIATATISNLKNPERFEVASEDILEELPCLFLKFNKVKFLEEPIIFRDKVEQLSFCPKNMSKWGVVLMGGCRQLSNDDWDILFF